MQDHGPQPTFAGGWGARRSRFRLMGEATILLRGLSSSRDNAVTLRLAGLNVYPIKGARGIALDNSEVDGFGLRHDRRWMVVNPSGEFLSQRTHPRLALIAPAIQDGTLRVTAPEMPPLELPLHPADAVRSRVAVWRDFCPASWLGEEPAGWFSEFLDCACTLVHMPDRVVRPADPAFAPAGTRVSFADGFPFLLISEESLADLNRRLAAPLPMNRFRPNLVVAGGEAYAEDEWREITIGEIAMQVVKPCGRCVVTTTDQMTAERGKEPLRTLATYRKQGGEVMFGQNVVHQKQGQLRVGDQVTLR
ncbi:MAG: MOSC domain-containing protein [Gemmatimonadales bacterium]